MQATLANTALRPGRWAALSLAAWALVWSAHASEKKDAAPAKDMPKADIEATTASNPKDVANKVRDALGTSIAPNKKLVVSINSGKRSGAMAAAGTDTQPETTTTLPPALSAANRRVYQDRAVAVSNPMLSMRKPSASAGTELRWTYDGDTGPQAWGRLQPEFSACGAGRRQSPISIEDGVTLQGPAEPLQFNMAPSGATVVNNGRTIQVDVQGDNTITVRGSTYRLMQLEFHSPAETQINFKRLPMAAHLVLRSMEGQTAIIAIQLDLGAANALVDKVWTYMPLDTGDRVRMPDALLNVAELLPVDQRYYQFMGSLTTPPCTEGVLWLVMKAPMTISKAQLKLLTQLYPNNARPLQPLNGRPVREAQ